MVTVDKQLAAIPPTKETTAMKQKRVLLKPLASVNVWAMAPVLAWL